MQLKEKNDMIATLNRNIQNYQKQLDALAHVHHIEPQN